MAKHSDLEREIADLRRRLQEVERAAMGLGRGEPLPATGTLEVVVCRVDTSRVALPLSAVERVVPSAATTPLPESPPWVHGLLRLGRTGVVMLDVAARIARRRRELELDDQVVICRDAETRVGLVVSEVLRVQTFALGPAAEPDSAALIPRGPYVRATLHDADGFVLLLCPRRLVESSEVPPQGPASSEDEAVAT